VSASDPNPSAGARRALRNERDADPLLLESLTFLEALRLERRLEQCGEIFVGLAGGRHGTLRAPSNRSKPNSVPSQR
jgi:hypothetical protein